MDSNWEIGYVFVGMICWFIFGLPLATIVFLGWGVNLFTQSRSRSEQIRNDRIRTRYFLLRSVVGVVAGSITGFIILILVTGKSDTCSVLASNKADEYYSTEERSVMQKEFQAMNCTTILKYDYPNRDLFNHLAILIPSAAPSIGIICAMNLFRKS